MNVPFLSFSPMHEEVREEMLGAFKDVYDSYWYVLGRQVTAFEEAYAAFNDVKHCVGLSNGLDALHIALKVLDVKSGDEVIVPSNTYIATVLAISYVGATPVFAEPDIATCNIDPDKIAGCITSKTRAIMPVHLYGQCCEMGRIMELARTNGLYVVEDNAQAHGAAFNGKRAGSWGHVNGTSFYPGKNLGALGDAGAITTDDTAIAGKAAMFRNYGSQKKYYNEVAGYNARLDELQAAFLSVKLKYLEKWTGERQRIAAWYDERLKGIEAITMPHTAPGASHVYHLYVIRLRLRDQLQQYLQKQGVGSLIHYPVPPHLQTAYTHLGYKRGDFPIAEEIADTCLSLPLWPGMTESQVETVTDTIKRFFKEGSK